MRFIPGTPADWVSFFILGCYILIGSLLVPFIKVEESFGTNAMYDIERDTPYESAHFTLHPDVVQRSPIVAYAIAMGLRSLSVFSQGFASLKAGRAALGVGVFLCLSYLYASLAKNKGKSVANLFLLLLASQFHIPFYASRFLPNTYGLVRCDRTTPLHSS